MDVSRSFFVGVIGDAILQMITYHRGNFAGLRDYFKQHGIMESLMIAGGIMFVAAYVWNTTWLETTWLNIFIYGGILDIIWRQGNLMPSLRNTYYAALSPVVSFIWGGIPMVMALYFSNV